MFGAFSAFLAFGILIPGCVQARETVNDNVVPPIFVQIVGESEKVIRVGVRFAQSAFKSRDGFFGAVLLLELESLFGGVIFVTLFERGAFPPVRTGNHVHLSVVVEVSEVYAFPPKLI